MKKEDKKALRNLGIISLKEKLNELKAEKIKLETDMYKGTKRNYPLAKQTHPYGNIKRIKKMIAFVNMLISEKLNETRN